MDRFPDDLSDDDDYHRITAERIRIYADLAVTFSEIAAVRKEPESRARTVLNARNLYEQILKQMPSLPMEKEDAAIIEGKLGILKMRLTELGELLD